jgi:hypothetical protein
MQPDDVCHNLSNFGLVERRPASHAVPSQQKFQHHIGVDAMPQQMPRSVKDYRALALRQAQSHVRIES